MALGKLPIPTEAPERTEIQNPKQFDFSTLEEGQTVVVEASEAGQIPRSEVVTSQQELQDLITEFKGKFFKAYLQG